MRLPPREGKPHVPFILFSDDGAESPIILWEQRIEGMFHHGLTADHTDESAITIHHRQFLELLLGEDSGHLSDMLVQKRLILLCSIRIHTTSPRLREPPPSPSVEYPK